MKAIELAQPTLDGLTLTDRPPAAAPGPGEITVRIRASSLNYHDYAVVTGAIPAAANRVPMSDGAGEVTAVGPGITDYAVGDAVVSLFFPLWTDGQRRGGGFEAVPGDGVDGFAREEVTLPASAFTRAPLGYSHAEAATLTCAGLTAWRALVPEGGLKAGDSVLVQGTGGVSIFALQIAKAMGATVVATSSSDAKLERLKALGADHIVNYRTEEKWGRAVLALTGGVGVDHVVEIGGAGTLDQSMIAARSGGHIAMIGVLTGRRSEVTTALLMQKELRVQGITVGSRRHQLDFIAAVEATGIRPVIDSHFPLADLAGAFRHQESNAHFGKIVVDI
ncbi:MAG: NAD(P)-dependent alcohol dehydrogenase [Sphingobium sp.]